MRLIHHCKSARPGAIAGITPGKALLPLIVCTLLALAFAGCGTRSPSSGGPVEPTPSDDDDDSSPSPVGALEFPKGFLWGVSSSAYQTEGGNKNSDYTSFLIRRTGKDECGMADDSYHRYEVDASLAAELGVQIARIGIEWARIEPTRGQYDEAEIAHYRDVLSALVSRGVRPMVTLHHFTNPDWVEEQGGWLNSDTVDRFVAYAKRMAQEYGDLVDYWLTFNEPMMYTSGLFLMAEYPDGGINEYGLAMQATVNMTFAHARAYHAIKEADTISASGDGPAAIVSLAQAIIPGRARRPDDADDIASAARYDYFINRMFLNSVTTGMLDVNGDGQVDDPNTTPPEGYYPELAHTLDFIGVNFYNSVSVLHFPFIMGPIAGVPCFPQAAFLCWPHGRPPYLHGDNGNPIEPDVLTSIIEEYQDAYRLPVLVTENGIATTDDYLRTWFIIQHLKAIRAALDDGYDVLGYLHWSLIDNFEWMQAYTMRFGLYRVNYDNFERAATGASGAFREIVRADAVSAALLRQYAQPPPIG